MTQAFVYHWQELSTNKWYIGSHSRKGCHPNNGYICSSKIVRPLIKANPNNWKRTIIAVGNPKDIVNFEIVLLTSLDAKNDPMSYNRSNGELPLRTGTTHTKEVREIISKKNKGKKRSEEFKLKLSKAKLGKKRSPHTEEWKKQHSLKMKGNKSRLGIKHTEEHKQFLRERFKGSNNPMFGRKQSEETKRKISEAKKRKQQL